MKYTSGLASGGTFHTDANGREMQRRERDARPTWALDVHEPVAGNYYPLTSAMYIEVGPCPLQKSCFGHRWQQPAVSKSVTCSCLLT